MLNILPAIVEGFSTNIVAYAVLLAAVATITMALLELVKALPLVTARLRFHQRRVRRWVANENAYRELLVLAVAGVDASGALYDQGTDKMMAQLQSAANVALDFPALYPSLYAFFTAPPASRAARTEVAGSTAGATEPAPDDADVWRAYSETLDGDRKGNELPEGAQRAIRARTRLDHFVTRKLDAFQTRTEYFWARGNQFVAFVGCAVFLWYILRSVPGIAASQRALLSAFGGMIAPVAKDLVTALTGLRARA